MSKEDKYKNQKHQKNQGSQHPNNPCKDNSCRPDGAHYVGMATFRVKPGQEKAFLSSVENELFRHCERMGATNCLIEKKPQTHDYVATVHWKDAHAPTKFMESREAKQWYEKASPMLEHSHRDFFNVQKRAA